MCLSPVTIVNRSKFLSKEYRQPYFMQVKCGKCAECQKQMSKEWHFRAHAHFVNAIENGQYVIFDTLTYDNNNLPHLSEFMNLPNPKMDFPCFDFRDVRLFLVRLRKSLRSKGFPKEAFDYFLASEYGTHNTCRPHYHVLFFVDGRIPFDLFSRLVSDCWQKGRTDGLPWKSRSYVRNHNVITSNENRVLRVTQYVTKYVMKSCAFQKTINSRINSVMECMAKDMDEGWIASYEGRKYSRDLTRQVSQFHRQCKGFGECAIKNIQFGQDMLTLPDITKYVSRIALPMYYKRKMYQKQIEIDGQRFWSWTEKGVEFLKMREKTTITLLSERLDGYCSTYGIKPPVGYSTLDIASYMVQLRGNYNQGQIASLEQKLDCPLMFNYITHNDFLQFQKKFVSDDYCGVKDNYLDCPLCSMDIEQVKAKCYFDERLEIWLSRLTSLMSNDNIAKQKLHEFNQLKLEKYKLLGFV